MSTIVLGGDMPLHRLGFGAMHLTGPDVWGPPTDPAAARSVARRAVELGVNFIDTADSYGPGTSEEVLGDALFPYPEGLVVATKAGQTRPSRGEWRPVGRPEYLRQQAELSLRRLRVDRIDLFQLHRIDPKVPAEEQFGVLRQLQDEGKVRHVGLSEVTVEQIEQARRQVDVASVQNLYNLRQRRHDAVVEHCEREGIVFIPWVPIASGDLARPDGALGRIAKQVEATAAQVALAWLLHRSPVIVPIPGTSTIAHLEENVAAASVELTPEQFEELSAEEG